MYQSTSPTNTVISGDRAHIAILLCAYNGEKFLSQQLDSIGRQTYPNWKIWISDDGSNDETLAICARYEQQWGRAKLQVIQGPSKGFAANFLSVVCRSDIDADYFAYSDQDDIWEEDKLARALERLETFGDVVPTLYCSRTRLIDEHGQPIGFSKLFKREPDFRNALVQNVGGGNTMMFNRAGRKLLVAAGPDLRVVAHDWWTYVAISAAGGKVVYDSYPSLLYRQHGHNLIGSNKGWGPYLTRICLLMKGQLRGWVDQNIAGLRRIAPQLSQANKQVFDTFVASRNGRLLNRICNLKRSGVFRQTFMGNVGIFVAALFKKL